MPGARQYVAASFPRPVCGRTIGRWRFRRRLARPVGSGPVLRRGPPPLGFWWLNAVRPRCAVRSVGRSGRGGRRRRGPLPVHLLPDGAHIDRSGRLSIAGVDLLDLCRAIGTPVFVYDEEHIRRRCREAVRAWGGGVAYASKAFLCRAMAQLVHEEGMAIDVSTGGELHVALAAGVPGSAPGLARQQQVGRRAGPSPGGAG